MAYLQYDPGSGAVTFDNGLRSTASGLASRFRGWTPTATPVGPTAIGLGTGRRFQFSFRTDYGASFSMEEIPNTSMAAMLALQAHLRRGGTVQVYTEDASSRAYTNCNLAPDGDVTIELTDPTALLYTMSFTLINLAGTAMICEY